MKLNELKTVTPQDLTPKPSGADVYKAMKKIQPPENMNVLGSGGDARTYGNDDEPGTVTRVTRTVRDPEKDSYYKYLSAIAKSDRIQRNPYFPKIYNVKIVEDKTGRRAYSVDMERLLEFDTLSAEECVMLGERMFFNFAGFAKEYVARHKEIVPQQHRDKVSMKSKGTAGFVLLKAIEKCINFGEQVATYVKDPRLKEAMIILRALIKNDHDVAPDIHDGNIMVRRGPGGPQLVLTDPVS
jgi:hypothetical protein